MAKVNFAVIIVFLTIGSVMFSAFAGTWSDSFERVDLGSPWRGDTDNFSILDGAVQGINAHPILLLPLKWVEVGRGWDDYVVRCRINVVTPNLLECTKGALLLRHSGKEGYVFALHVATKTVEVYSLSDGKMLLSKEEPLELETWYEVRAELQGENMSFFLDGKLIGKLTDRRSASGSVGLAVQDTLKVLFDDFSVTGTGVDPGTATIRSGDKLPSVWASIKTNFKERGGSHEVKNQ
jgi:hypothetical protein